MRMMMQLVIIVCIIVVVVVGSTIATDHIYGDMMNHSRWGIVSPRFSSDSGDEDI